MSIASIVNQKVNSLFVKSLRDQKGWSKQYAANLIVQFIFSGSKVSFYDYMSAAK